jgi:hypothetical protein
VYSGVVPPQADVAAKEAISNWQVVSPDVLAMETTGIWLVITVMVVDATTDAGSGQAAVLVIFTATTSPSAGV